MRVLDTCVVLNWLRNSEMPAPHRRILLGATMDAPLWISAITIFEITNLARLGRAGMKPGNTQRLLGALRSAPTVVLDVTAEIAEAAAAVPDTIHDPADRLIMATAAHMDCALLTTDRAIIGSGYDIQTI